MTTAEPGTFLIEGLAASPDLDGITVSVWCGRPGCSRQAPCPVCRSIRDGTPDPGHPPLAITAAPAWTDWQRLVAAAQPCGCGHTRPHEHPRWQITGPNGQRHTVTDALIATYGRTHVEHLLRGLPPLPAAAWAASPAHQMGVGHRRSRAWDRGSDRDLPYGWCLCRWAGPPRSTERAARADMEWHLCEVAGRNVPAPRLVQVGARKENGRSS